MVYLSQLGLISTLFFKFAVNIYAFTDGLLPNGDFEQAVDPNLLRGSEVIGHDSIPHWETSGFVEYIKSGQMQGHMLLAVPDGGHAVKLGNDAYIKHKVAVVKGKSYAITLTASRTCGQAEELYLSVGAEYGIIPIQTIYDSDGWDSYAWAFVAPTDEVDVVIHNPDSRDEDDCGPIIDLVAIELLQTPTSFDGNLLKNGGFEEGPYFFASTPGGVMIPPITNDHDSALPGWVVKSLKAIRYIDSDHYTVPRGQRAVELLTGKEGVILQTVKTEPRKQYMLSFIVGDANNTCEGSMAVEAYAGTASTTVHYESIGEGGFKRAMLRFISSAHTTNVVFFSSFYGTKSSDSTLCGPVLDDVHLVKVG